MILKSLLTAACAVAIAGTCAIVSTAPARAQDVQAELLGLTNCAITVTAELACASA